MDTGAQASVLVAPIPGVALLPADVRVAGADGHPIPILGAQRIKINLLGQKIFHKFLVLTPKAHGSPLLGMDLLCKVPMGIYTDTGEAYLRRRPTSSSRHSRLGPPTATLRVITEEEAEDDECFPDSFLTQEIDTVREEEGALLATKLKHLSDGEAKQVKTLLDRFPNIFSPPGPSGCNLEVYHEIDTGDTKPIARRPYPVPYALRSEVERQLRKMQEDGIIERSASPWSAPIVLVKKKSVTPDHTEYRFCTDFRELNKVTKADAYPLPRIQEMLDFLGGNKYFTTLDLQAGYHQIAVCPRDQEKTAFTTMGEHYHYTRMPFGLRNAPATFQRLMNRVLEGLTEKRCAVYLDDIIVVGRSWEEHIGNLTLVLARLQEAQLKLQLKKCYFLQHQVEYLGHIISEYGITTDPKKTEAVRQFPVPNNPTALRAFLGLASYYRRFVKDFAVMSAPLTKLLRKDQPFHWTEEQEVSMNQIKNALVSPQVLAYPDFEQPFILATDASGKAIGAVLSQIQDGRERPLAYASRTLNPAETRYTITERELLAAVWGVKHFQHFLLGRRFRLQTDHIALTYALKLRDPTSRIARWVLKLADFDFETQYRPGNQLGHVDGLSRAQINNIQEISCPAELLRTAQSLDPWTNSLAHITDGRYLQKDGIQYLVGKDNGEQVLKPLIPSALRSWYLELCHSSPWAGHAGVERTLALLQRHCHWPKMISSVKEYVKACEVCQKRNNPTGLTAPIQQPYIPTKPGDIIGIDIVGPLSPSRGFTHILTVVDHFTKYAEAYPLQTTSTRTICDILLREYFTRHGIPERILSDRGANFTSSILKELCQLHGIKKLQTTAYHPQSNGVVERFHRTLVDIIAKLSPRQGCDWADWLPIALAAYRNLRHGSTGYSPNYLVYGRELSYQVPEPHGMPQNAEWQKRICRLRRVYTSVQTTLLQEWKQRERTVNARRTPRYFQEGQPVYLRQMAVPTGIPKKFFSPWIGPLTIQKRLSEVTYVLQDTVGKTQIVHISRLKPAYTQHRNDGPGYLHATTKEDQPRLTRASRIEDPTQVYGNVRY